MNPVSPLKKTESFYIVELKPEPKTPLDKRIQKVVLPAMLVKTYQGKEYLIFEQ